MWTDPGNIQMSHRHMNVEIGTEAAQFPEKEYISGIFLAVQCIIGKSDNDTDNLKNGKLSVGCNDFGFFKGNGGIG